MKPTNFNLHWGGFCSLIVRVGGPGAFGTPGREDGIGARYISPEDPGAVTGGKGVHRGARESSERPGADL